MSVFLNVFSRLQAETSRPIEVVSRGATREFKFLVRWNTVGGWGILASLLGKASLAMFLEVSPKLLGWPGLFFIQYLTTPWYSTLSYNKK